MFTFLKAKPAPRKSIDDIRAEVQDRHDHIGGVIAARFARVNISIQEGALLMDEDLHVRKSLKDEVDAMGNRAISRLRRNPDGRVGRFEDMDPAEATEVLKAIDCAFQNPKNKIDSHGG